MCPRSARSSSSDRSVRSPDVQHELSLPAVARTLLPQRWKRMQTCRLRRPQQRPGLRLMQRARFRDTLALETRHGLLQRPARTACRPSGASGGPRPTVFPCAARSATGRERRGCHAHRWLPRSTGASSCAAQAPVLFLILCWRMKTCSQINLPTATSILILFPTCTA